MNDERIESNLTAEEGYSLHTYYIYRVLHIGRGHKIVPSDNLKDGDTITTEREIDIFAHDRMHAQIAARAVVPRFAELPDDLQNIMVEMAYNMGQGNNIHGLKSFHAMLTAIAMRDKFGMIAELLDSDAARRLPERYARYAKRMERIEL